MSVPEPVQRPESADSYGQTGGSKLTWRYFPKPRITATAAWKRTSSATLTPAGGARRDIQAAGETGAAPCSGVLSGGLADGMVGAKGTRYAPRPGYA
jgi:hypothetical protein